MKITGPNETALRLIDATKSAGRGESLVAGAIISAVVRERLDPELYRVSIGSKLYSAISAQALEPGTVLKARVERSGDAILLRLANPAGREAALASALSAAALPNDAAARAAVSALLREGLAPEVRALTRVRRAALRDAAEGGEWTDLAAKMEAKGIPSESPVLEDLASLLDGRRGGTDGGGQAGGDTAGQREKGTVAEQDLPRVLGALLRSIVTRSGSGGEAPSGLSLALFNHLRGPEGSWVIVPFHFALDAVDFCGSFRIQLPYARGGQGLFEADFSVSRGALPEDWSFFLKFGGGRAPALRIDGPALEGIQTKRRYDDFAAGLMPFSCSVRMAHGGEDADTREAGLDLDA